MTESYGIHLSVPVDHDPVQQGADLDAFAARWLAEHPEVVVEAASVKTWVAPVYEIETGRYLGDDRHMVWSCRYRRLDA